MVDRLHVRVLKFISLVRGSHSRMVDIFCFGSCMNFFLILDFVFDGAVAYYNCDHIVTKIGGRFYDVTGEVDGAGFLPFDSYYNDLATSRVFDAMMNGEYTFCSGCLK